MKARLQSFTALLRRRRDFRQLWISNMISLLGDWFSYVAISLVALKQGESAFAVGVVFAAHMLPLVLMSPISGPLTDRMDRRRLLTLAYLGAAGITVAMWVAAESGAVWWLQGLLAIRVAVSGLGMTARMAAIPQLVEPDELYTANALIGLSWSVLFAAGVALGGFLAAWLGAGTAILIDAVTFVLAIFVVRTLPPLPAPVAKRRPQIGMTDLYRAWKVARADGYLLSVLLAKVPSGSTNAAAWVSLTMLADVRMTSAAVGLGLMHALRGIGTGLGPLLPGRFIPHEANLGTPMMFAGVAVFAIFGTPWIALPALILWGMGTGHNWVASTAELQAQSPPELLGRMTAVDSLVSSAAQTVLAISAGLLIDWSKDPAAGVWLGLLVGGGVWMVVMVRRARSKEVRTT